MRTLILIIFFILIQLTSYSQFGRGANWHIHNMSNNSKFKYSVIWKSVGLSMVSAGLYLGSTNQNPQGIDTPLIIIGSVFTLEGIRLGKLVNKQEYRMRKYRRKKH